MEKIHTVDIGSSWITLSNKTTVYFGDSWFYKTKEEALQAAQRICDALNGEPAAVLSSPQPDRLAIAAKLLSGLLSCGLTFFRSHKETTSKEVLQWADTLINQSKQQQ